MQLGLSRDVTKTAKIRIRRMRIVGCGFHMNNLSDADAVCRPIKIC